MAWMKNTFSPQYVNLKSGWRPESMILVAFVVFSKNLEDITIKGSLTGGP